MDIDENAKSINETLIDFWNSAISLSEEEREEEASEKADYRELAPSRKLFVAVSELKDSKKVLDYGCGNGWASIVAAKSGCQDVTAVDLGENIVETAKFYANLYGVGKYLKIQKVPLDYLSNTPSGSFDGFICSNVLDVIPISTSQEIIKEASRILTKGSKAIIGMNFFISEEMAKDRNMKLEDRCLFVDNVLRLVSYSDEEWLEMFAPYFDLERLDHFAWPNEKEEKRRLFVLRRK